MAAVGRFLLILALVGSPWYFGSVQPWPQFVLGALVGGLTLLRAAQVLLSRPEGAVHLPMASLGGLGLLLIGAMQLLPGQTPLPTQMQHAVYAEDGALFADITPDSPRTLSPASTRREAARVYLALAAFLLAAQWFSEPGTHRLLLGALALNGAALGAFGIVQRLSWNGLLFWSVEMRFGGTPFASYVNRNNAAGYLNICLGAAIGLTILVWALRPSGRQRLSTISERIRYAIAQIDGPQVLGLGLLVVLVSAVLFALSRGGMVALGVAALGLILVAFRGVARIGLIVFAGLLLLAATGLLMYSGQLEVVDERIDTLGDPVQAASGRVEHWRDTLGAVRDFPLLGTGLGTYRYANLPYQQHPAHAWYYNADNEWFEVLVEVGLVGALLALTGMGLIGACSLLLLRRRDPQSRAIGAAGLFVVLSQSTQAVTDFGLLLPANALAFAVLTGAVCGTACRQAEFERLRIPLWLSLARLEGRGAQIVLGLVLATASGAFVLELFAATTADAARDFSVELDPQTRVGAVDAILARMEESLQLRPDDGEVHQALGNLLIDRCRLALYAQLLEDNPEATPHQQRQFWQSAAPTALALHGAQLKGSGQRAEWNQLRTLPALEEYLPHARAHFRLAVENCPLIRGSATWLARLDFLEWDIPDSQIENSLKRARFTAPSSPRVLVELAALAEYTGDPLLAEQCWSRALEAAPAEGLMVWKAARQFRQPAELIDTVIADRGGALVEIAEKLNVAEEQQLVLEHAQNLQQHQQLRLSARDAGRLAELQSKPEVAIEQYRLALSESPWDSTTRLRLARLLNRQGRFSEADLEYSLLLQQLPIRKDILDERAALRLRELDELRGTGRSDSTDEQK